MRNDLLLFILIEANLLFNNFHWCKILLWRWQFQLSLLYESLFIYQCGNDVVIFLICLIKQVTIDWEGLGEVDLWLVNFKNSGNEHKLTPAHIWCIDIIFHNIAHCHISIIMKINFDYIINFLPHWVRCTYLWLQNIFKDSRFFKIKFILLFEFECLINIFFKLGKYLPEKMCLNSFTIITWSLHLEYSELLWDPIKEEEQLVRVWNLNQFHFTPFV